MKGIGDDRTTGARRKWYGRLEMKGGAGNRRKGAKE